jgi:protein ImuA
MLYKTTVFPVSQVSVLLPERADVWRGDALSVPAMRVLPSGHAGLDAELPGGGWPAAGLTELLCARSDVFTWQLLLPALLGLQAGRLLLVGGPTGVQPFVPALVAQGLDAARLLWVRAEDDQARLWAAEQALRCADVSAVLAWLPRVRAEGLRRLHWSGLEHGRPLFAWRAASARQESSPAPLRLWVQSQAGRLQVQVFKRRGPPMQQALELAAQPAALGELLGLRQRRRVEQPRPQEVGDVLDRVVSA